MATEVGIKAIQDLDAQKVVLEEIESEKWKRIREIEALVTSFKGSSFDEDDEDEIRDKIYEIAYDAGLEIDTINLESGNLDWWQPSTC